MSTVTKTDMQLSRKLVYSTNTPNFSNKKTIDNGSKDLESAAKSDNTVPKSNSTISFSKINSKVVVEKHQINCVEKQ